jgi:hypothetical protein
MWEKFETLKMITTTKRRPFRKFLQSLFLTELLRGHLSCGNYHLRGNPYRSQYKSRLNSPKNHTYDYTRPYRIFYPNSTLFVRYKNNKFQLRKKSESYLDNLLQICYLISHKRSRVWTEYFTRLYIVISSTHVNFFSEFIWPFCCSSHRFSRRL